MPELPEVQTVVNDLNDAIVGFMIVDFYSLWEKNIVCGLVKFKQKVVGKKIVNVKRIGKFILLELDSKDFVVLHLRMTGQLLVVEKAINPSIFEEKKRKHLRHWWILERKGDKIGLFFHDVRKFATIDYIKKLDNYKSFIKLGLEPLSEGFKLMNLSKILETQKSVRSVLLDQSKIVGIGNIYVSEILFRAGIYPGRASNSLSQVEIKSIYAQIKFVLKKAVKLRGTTFSDYRDSKGEMGGFQNFLKVYNKKNSYCEKKGCTGVIQKETLNQRSSFWCPVCQKS